MKGASGKSLRFLLVLAILLPGLPAAEDEETLPALESMKETGSPDWEGRRQGDRALMAIGALITTYGLVRYFQGDRNASKWDFEGLDCNDPRDNGLCLASEVGSDLANDQKVSGLIISLGGVGLTLWGVIRDDRNRKEKRAPE